MNGKELHRLQKKQEKLSIRDSGEIYKWVDSQWKFFTQLDHRGQHRMSSILDILAAGGWK
jgi:hypothetical protein